MAINQVINTISVRKILRKIVFFFLFFISVSQACEVTDDAGQKIHFMHPAKRIVSLAPDLTELLFAAGAGEKIVGVVRGSDYPEAAKKIPIVASYDSMNAEAILVMHPDLITAWAGGNAEMHLQQVRQFHIPIFLSDQHDLSDIPRTLQRLGCLAGTEQTADKAAEKFSQQYHALQQRYARKKATTVFYIVWPHPLTTINKDSWINQIITLCGGKNIFADLKTIAPEVNLEAVIAANPDVIIGPNTTDWQKEWRVWSRLTAVQKKHLYSIHPDWVERAGPRLIDGANEICQLMSNSMTDN